MDLIKPAFGLIFWMTISFLIVLFILKKYAWKPILDILKEREDSIEKALNEAKRAREELIFLKAANKDLINEVRAERDKILKEAKDIKNEIIAEAKIKAKEEADKMIKLAREAINNEKKAAIAEIKGQVAVLSIEIAKKILRSELSEDKKQKALISNLLEDIKLN